VEFAGWQHGAEMGMHVGPVGARTFLAEEEGERRFAYATDGDLRHVLRVPAGARLRLSLRPVLPGDAPGPLKPVVPAATQLHTAWRADDIHTPEHLPDVFIYVIDALRPDHLGCYGYPRETSPNIDAFARDATLYERAQTPATWTRPSVASMLSGLYPMVHGAMHRSDVLGEWPVLLPEMLQAAGYTTGSIVANPVLAAHFGFDQGYDSYDFEGRVKAARINRRAAEMLATLEQGQSVFMYLHTMEPHDPYTPAAESFRRFDRGFEGRCDGSRAALEEAGCVRPNLSEDDVAHLVDLYDAEVFEADQGFAEFIGVLRDAGRFENALIILVSDHGEGFAEHDTLCHGRNLNREEMRVVLVVRYPEGEWAGRRVGHRVSLLDVLPTIATAVGVGPEIDYRLPGRPLQNADGRGDRLFFAEVSQQDSNAHDLVGVIDEKGFKRVVDVSVLPRETATKESLGLWDTESDGAEVRDLSGSMPVRTAYCDQTIVRWLYEQREWRRSLGVAAPPPAELTDELRDQLRDLGYLR
jgi:arylsulfatase A-like enzyme